MQLQELIESLLNPTKIHNLEMITPFVIEELSNNILVKAKFYDGDLLMTVISVDSFFWKDNPVLWKQLVKIIDNQNDKMKVQQVSFEMKVDWYEKIERFKSLQL